MEIFELRYFLAVARNENLHRASERLHISPSSLSKAISRLEEELSVGLFVREGRNIRLTDHGKIFKKRATEIVQLAESAKLELAGHQGVIHVVIAGPEILLSEMGVSVSRDLKSRFANATFEFQASSDEDAINKVKHGEAHLAIVTSEAPSHSGLSAKIISEPLFQTVAGKGHPLYAMARSKKTISIKEVLEHPFVSPNHPLLGKVELKQSLDGWRDDLFPRRIAYLTSSLKLLEELVSHGKALAYLPDYHVRRLDLAVLKISGCPYSCSQTVKLVAKNPKDRSWLNHWF